MANPFRGATRRVAFYSHDTMGLGHGRRNLLIAQALAGAPMAVTILLIAGVREVGAFPVQRGIDTLTLPALRKTAAGSYEARNLALGLPEIVHLRARTIDAALDAFEPDVFVVDNVPRGAMHELDVALARLRAKGQTQCVLGLRDIIDDPETVSNEWARAQNEDVIRKYYDAIWVYGDRAVYDVVKEYGLAPDLAARTQYTGYLDQRARCWLDSDRKAVEVALSDRPANSLVVCLLGGGQDGERLAEAFAWTSFPPGVTGVILSGPFLPADVRDRLRLRAVENPRLLVLDFLVEPGPLLARADRIVAMGGYNTVGEILSYGKRALIVPRVSPRREQWIRAQRLRELGLVDVLHPSDASPAALGEWLDYEFHGCRLSPPVRERVDLGGLNRLLSLFLLDALVRSTSSRRSQVFAKDASRATAG